MEAALGQNNASLCLSIAIVGSKDCAMSNISDLTIHIPSTITPRIQECQLIVEHILCQIVEMYIFPKER